MYICLLLLIVFKRLWGREYTKAPQRLGGTCGCLSILTLQTLQPCSGLSGPGQKPQNHLTLQSHRAGRHSTGSLSLFLYHSYVWNLLLDNYYHFSFHGPFYFLLGDVSHEMEQHRPREWSLLPRDCGWPGAVSPLVSVPKVFIPTAGQI